jgi:hypothetical protein
MRGILILGHRFIIQNRLCSLAEISTTGFWHTAKSESEAVRNDLNAMMALWDTRPMKDGVFEMVHKTFVGQLIREDILQIV